MGDYVQSISGSEYSTVAVTTGLAATVLGGPVGGTLAGVSFISNTLGMTKTVLDYQEGESSTSEFIKDITVEATSRAPYAGPLIQGGDLLYETVKDRYNENRNEEQ